MTLILSVANKDFVAQISDRRLSTNGRVVNEDSNKSGYLITDDSQMLFGFTGIAEYQSFKARRWIMDMLMKSKAPDLYDIFENFTKNATEYFNTDQVIQTLSPQGRRLSIMFTGFVKDRWIANCIITNYQDFESCKDSVSSFDRFKMYSFIGDSVDNYHITFIQRIGNWALMTVEDENVLRDVLRSKPKQYIKDKAISIVRKISDISGNTVGKEINVVCLDRGKAFPTAQYCTTMAKTNYYLSDMCDLRSNSPNLQISDMTISSEDFISIPKVGRNKPCPCGNKLKYKQCHGS